VARGEIILVMDSRDNYFTELHEEDAENHRDENPP